ncbi:MAG TPA: HNH endonuclease [Candidatus Eisenbacteria bacterium]|nr:HNH endonuclease [Candidatus Eisenbacteria bacterium]
MRTRPFTLLADRELLRTLQSAVVAERRDLVTMIALIAEVDARRLYRGAGCPSMYAYCRDVLHFAEDVACKRITAARLSGRIPALLPALEDGRLNLSGVMVLARHLTPANADELLSSAYGRRRAEIEELIARRFPTTESLAMIVALPPSPVGLPLEPERVENPASHVAPALVTTPEPAPGRIASPTSTRIAPPPPTRIVPIAAQRHVLQLTMGEGLRDKLERLRELLSHQIPDGDLEQVLEHAVDAAIARLEKRKFAATDGPRTRGDRPGIAPRTIPALVRRAVRRRDGGRCTFVGDNGRRCESRRFLEFDHITPVAHGGRATADNIRLRCRAHNQLEAERIFGADFMHARATRSAKA